MVDSADASRSVGFGFVSSTETGLVSSIEDRQDSKVVFVALTPATRAFLDDVDALLDRKEWPDLDRDRSRVTASRDSALLILPHRREQDRTIELEIDDHAVEIRYEPERIRFTRREEALRFVEMLGDGRVELLVQRNPVWTSMRSYRDGLALPFRRTGVPWLNLRFATERLRFGFQ
jgi:hypothetical protein